MNKAIAMEKKESTLDAPSQLDQKEQPESLVGWKGIWKPLSIIAGVFLVFFWLPVNSSRFTGAVIESLAPASYSARIQYIVQSATT